MPQGIIWEIAAASFGIAAAVILVAGGMILRYQRDRHHFQLMQAALERGITSMPGMAPTWVLSLRQGVLALILGLGVLAAGFTLRSTANLVEPPPTLPAPPSTPSAAAPPVNSLIGSDEPPLRRPPPPRNAMGNNGPPNDGPPGEGPNDRPPDQHDNLRDNRNGPPHQSPAMERWHRIESQRLAGLLAICTGGILSLLGIVRIAFSKIERKYASDPPTPIT